MKKNSPLTSPEGAVHFHFDESVTKQTKRGCSNDTEVGTETKLTIKSAEGVLDLNLNQQLDLKEYKNKITEMEGKKKRNK